MKSSETDLVSCIVKMKTVRYKVSYAFRLMIWLVPEQLSSWKRKQEHRNTSELLLLRFLKIENRSSLRDTTLNFIEIMVSFTSIHRRIVFVSSKSTVRLTGFRRIAVKRHTLRFAPARILCMHRTRFRHAILPKLRSRASRDLAVCSNAYINSRLSWCTETSSLPQLSYKCSLMHLLRPILSFHLSSATSYCSSTRITIAPW